MKKNYRLSFKPLNGIDVLYFVFLIIVSMAIVGISIYKAKVLGLILENLRAGINAFDYLVMFAGIFLVYVLLVFLQTVFKNKYRLRIEYAYKQYTEKNIIESTMHSIRKVEEGDLITRMSSDLSRASSYLTNGLLPFVHNLILISTSIFSIMLVYSKMLIYLIPMLILFFFLQIIVSKPLYAKRKLMFEKYGFSNAVAVDIVDSYFQVKINDLEKWSIDRYDKSLEKIKKTYFKTFPFIILFMSVGFFFSMMPLVFMMFYASHLVGLHVISVSNFILIISLGINITKVITQLSQNTSLLQTLGASLARVSKIWDFPKEEEVFRKVEAYKFDDLIQSAVQLKGIYFGYNTKKQLLNNFSYSFNKKKYIVLGKNGIGKSTIINLMTGLYIPDQGCITYPFVMEKRLDNLRNKIVVAEQNSYLFNDSIENNIFVDEVDEEYKNKWLLETHFKTVIEKMPEGKNTVIAEGGKNLSGGQKRMIGVARAMVKAPDSEIIILDEPTANVDFETAEMINREIVRVCEQFQKTIIIITHDEHLINIGPDVEMVNFEDIILKQRL